MAKLTSQVRIRKGENKMNWRESWRRSPVLTELPMTHPIGNFGEFGLAVFYSREYPTCSNHGAMAKVSADRNWWRCLVCHIGCEWLKERSNHAESES